MNVSERPALQSSMPDDHLMAARLAEDSWLEEQSLRSQSASEGESGEQDDLGSNVLFV
ncbi:hypothetical protein [Effusibacillus lacus]|uniref:hypothetical protein n=1 Tax=Effusibacillus lacus TaxID=1348429 RepID=UPI0010E4A9B6|nr:hypothetical protein [Effusibacillus lacus]TCS69539.1 hypothetical protein EDD64_13656 [Effusibacillus lacus]